MEAPIAQENLNLRSSANAYGTTTNYVGVLSSGTSVCRLVQHSPCTKLPCLIRLQFSKTTEGDGLVKETGAWMT
jgi:hypothetical protein